MPEISANGLVMAIQAVDAKIWMLREQIDKADEGDRGLCDLEDLMLAYCTTAEEMRQAYEKALMLSCNLPPYEKLVRE
jgi:hypothetical protein